MYPDPNAPEQQKRFGGKPGHQNWVQRVNEISEAMNDTPLGAPAPAISQPAKAPKSWRTLILGSLVALLLMVLAGVFGPAIKDTLIPAINELSYEVSGGAAKAIAKKCGDGTYQLGDNGNSISFSVQPSATEQVKFIYCVLDEAGIPDKVRFRIGNSRFIDGAQQADWDGWELYWTSDLKAGEAKILLSKV